MPRAIPAAFLRLLASSAVVAFLCVSGAPAAGAADDTSDPESFTRRADYRRLQIEMLRRGPMAKLRIARERARDLKRGRAPRGAARVNPWLPDDSPELRVAHTWSGLANAPLAAQGAAAIPANAQCNSNVGDGASAAQSETAVAVLGQHVVVAWNDGHGFDTFPYGEGQGFAWSADGGATFTDGGDIPHPAAYPAWLWTSDPVLTVNEKTGEFWYCGLADPTSTTNAIGVARGRFTAGVFAFDSVFVVRSATSTSVFLDKQWMAADSSNGNLYVCNTTFTTSGDQIDFHRSTNGGRTWSAAATISSAGDMGLVQGSRVAVGPGGEVHAVWSALETNAAIDTDHYRYRKSTNGGASFGPEVTCVDHISNYGTGAPGFNRERGITFPSIAVDRTAGPRRGRVYLAWNESYDWLNDPFPAITAGISKVEVESNSTTGTATPATVGQVLRGTLATTSNTTDVDYFALPMAAGQHVIVYADSFTASRSFTLRMFAPNPDGAQRLAYGGKTDSTASTVTSSVWTYTAPVSGTYYLRIAAISRRTMGYRIRTVSGARGAERGRDARDAFVTWSDNGASWASPVRVNDDAVGYDNYLPEVSVGADGMPYVTAFDFRGDTYGSRANLYLTRSADGGATWAPNQRITSATGNFTTSAANMAPNMGDYLALGAGASSVHAAWADARGANVDVWSAAVATTSSIVSGPADTTITAPGSADFGWSVANANTVFGGTYAAQWSSARNWPLPAAGAPVVAAGASAWAQASFSVPDTAAAGANTVCLTLRGPGGVVVGQDCFTITVIAGQLGVGGDPQPAFALARSTPNPARGTSSISWSLPRAGQARLTVYDLSGARVRTLVDGPLPAGQGSATWYGDDERGQRVRAGAYFYSLEFEGQRLSRRMVIVR